MLGRRTVRNSRLPLAALAALFLAACQTAGVGGNTNTNLLPEPSNPAVGSQVNLQSLTDVINRNPSDPSAYNVRGIAYAESGRTRDAIADFDRAISLDPSFFQAYANRALVLAGTGRFDEAIADYNRALQINPSYGIAYAGRGDVYRQLGQFAQALADFGQALSIDPADAQSYYDRGLIYQAQGQQELALADFSSAISFQPRVFEPYQARGELYLAQGNWDAAFEDFFQAISLGGNTAENWANLGIALENLDDLPTANTAYRNALVIDSNYPPAVAGAARTAAFAAAQTAGIN